MKNKIIIYIVSTYFVLLTIVLITQIPKKEIIAVEPLAAELKYEDKLKNAVVLYVDSPVAIVNEKQILIDNNNPEVVPIIKDGTTFIPVNVMSKVFNANVSYSKSETTVRLNNKAVVLKNDSNIIKIIDSDSEKTIEASKNIFNQDDIIYVPVRNLTQAFEKELFFDDGLIVISNIENIFDPAAEGETINELKLQVNNLPVIGNEQKLKELIGDSNSILDYGKSFLFDENIEFDFSNGGGAGGGSPSGVEKIENEAQDNVSSDYSNTNTQVAGVDEADIIKNDGEYIYYTNLNKVHIVKAMPAEEMNKVSDITFDEDFSPSEIYINDNKLVVIGNTKTYTNVYNPKHSSEETQIAENAENITSLEQTTETFETQAEKENDIISKEYNGDDCSIYIYNIYDKSNPKLLRNISIDGYYNTSRIISDNLYVISNVSVFELLKNKRYMPPSYYDSLEKGKRNYLDYNDIYYFPCMTETNYTIIAGIKLDDEKESLNIYSYLGSGENIYVSNNNLYIANTKTINSRNNKINLGDYSSKTYIYKFSLNNGIVNYEEKGDVFGTVLNQFSMDENNGYFRVATTSYDITKSKKSNNMFVLDENLNVYGKIEDIAPGEQIYSARFIGDKAYMVTFEKTDPLFVLDLKHPSEPKILGALKIPGYSNYLHPYDENHLIGFGKDTVVYNDNAYYTSMKISIFDVSDITNPIEKFTEVIGDRGTDSELLTNHKALLFDKEKNLLSFPIFVFENENKDETIESQINYGNFVFQGAYVYNIDINNGFKLKCKISHLDEQDHLKSGIYGADTEKYIKRILYIDNYIYTISNKSIKVNDLKNFEEKCSINLY